VLHPIMIDNRERIKQKAHEMIRQFGIRSVSMDNIATALGISKKTIYQYFADKDELVMAIIRMEIDENQSACMCDSQKAKNAIHEVFLAMQMMQDLFENMNPTIIHDLEKFHPKAFVIVHEHKYKFMYNVLRKNIERGIAEELYRSDIDIETITKARIEIMLMPFNQQVFPNNKFKLVDVGMQLTEHFLFGLASLKGHKLILKYKQERLKQTKE
ncbi:MAG: hypothetical protein RLY16_495, partial [Bacteroidota bacterium]